MLRTVFSLWLLILVPLAGCKSEPKLLLVKGTVKLGGEPLASVDIIFHPKNGGQELAYRGCARSEADGTFTVLNASGVEGMPAGEYIVTFSKLVTKGGTAAKPGTKPEGVSVVELLPVRYTKPETSPESANVTSSQTEFIFELQAP